MLNKNPKTSVLIVFVLLLTALAVGQTADDSKLTLERIFTKNEFRAQGLGGFRWDKTGDSYSKLELSSVVKGGTDLVSYNIATNERRVLAPAQKLVPSGAAGPLQI